MTSRNKLLAISATLAFSAGCKSDKTGTGDEPVAQQAKVVAPSLTNEPEAPEPAVASTEEVLARHLEAFGSGKLEQILADYSDQAVMVTSMGTVTGKEGLRDLFQGLIAEFAKPGATFKMGQQMIKGEVAYITWSAETADNVYEIATDTFVVVDGKIAYQTFAGKITPKNVSEGSATKPDEPDEASPDVPVAGSTRAVLMHHLGAFGEGNLQEILSDYTGDSVLLSQSGEIVGSANLAPLFEGLFAEFAKPGAKFQMDKLVVEGDVAFIEWSAETADNVYEWATDTFVIRDGKVVYQTLTAKVAPKS